MKKILFALLLISSTAFSQFKTPPKILEHSFVQDYDHVLTSDQVSKLNQQIDTLVHHYSAQIAVVILSDLQNHEIEEAALAFGRDWGVGLKDTNNGIVYLIAPKLHQARLEVGYGLEGNIPDISAKLIGDGATSYYKKGDWYGGISYVLTQVQKDLDQKHQESKSDNAFVYIVILGVIMFVILCMLAYFWKTKDEDEEEEPEYRFSTPGVSTPLAAAALGATLSEHKHEDEDEDEDEESTSSSSYDDNDSSSSSFGSSDSGSDLGDFGGGSFGGGGATSSW